MNENRFDRESARLSAKFRIDLVRSGAQFPLFPLTILQGQGRIHGEVADPRDIESYWPLFSTEWNVYPTELMAKTRMKHIILCQGLAYEDPILSEPQPRTALPDLGYTSPPDHQPPDNHLYIDVKSGRHDELYVRAVIHHEFFHIIDWVQDKSFDKDDAWRALNPTGFTYGMGGETEQENPLTSDRTVEVPGFLNQYSRSGLIEDKAEVFAYMVVDPQYMAERAMRDDIIRKKMHTMTTRLREFCPQLDDQFWERAGAVERPNVQPRIVARPMV